MSRNTERLIDAVPGVGRLILEVVGELIAEDHEKIVAESSARWGIDERRFQAAKAAMEGALAADPDGEWRSADLAEYSVGHADALLAELAKTRGPA